MTLTSGTKLGRYEIRSQIGEAGMGEVYLAQDETRRGLFASFSRGWRVSREACRVSRDNLPVAIALHPYVRDAQLAFDIHSLERSFGCYAVT